MSTTGQTDPARGQPETVRENEPCDERDLDSLRSLSQNLVVELDAERKKSSDLAKRMMYLQADIANIQRQSEKRENEAREGTRVTYLLQIISIKEDLERAISVSTSKADRSVLDGLSVLVSRIESDLKAEHVEKIEAAAGASFDPRFHEAVAYSQADAKEDGTILSIISNGYTFRGKVIRPTMVEVARRKHPLHVQEERKENQESHTGNACRPEIDEIGEMRGEEAPKSR